MKWIDYNSLDNAEITHQVIAVKRFRSEGDEHYDDAEDFLQKTCTVFCALEENKYGL